MSKLNRKLLSTTAARHGPESPSHARHLRTPYALSVWLTQWGSKSLGDQGYSPIEIIRYFYGDDMYINTAEEIAGVPLSWPGAPLDIGSTGSDVRTIQEQLNAIASVYTAIPSLVPDGIFGERTQAAVREFQSIFGLPQTGVVDFATWYRISAIYVAVTRIAELR